MRGFILFLMIGLLGLTCAQAQQSGATARTNLGVNTFYDGQHVGLFTDQNGALYTDCYVGCSGSSTNYGTPTNSGAVAIGTSPTNVGSPLSAAHYIIVQAQGTAPVCLTFAAGTLSAPTASGECVAGDYMQPGQSLSYSSSSGSMPNSQLKAIATAAGTSWVTEDAQ